jgi:superfamily II DNA or RNA helicase
MYVPDIKGVRITSKGDYNTEDAASKYDEVIVGNIVENYEQMGEGRQAIVFANNVANSKLICEMFRGRGHNAEHIDGYATTDAEIEQRTEAVRKHKSGELKILVNCAIAIKGYDNPPVSCVIICRITKSKSMIVQMIGRVLRSCEGKTDAIVLDNSGSILRVGLPVDIDAEFEALCDGTQPGPGNDKQPTTKEPKPCGNCGALKTAHKCRICGFAPERQGELATDDSLELREITKADNDSKDKARWTKAKKAAWMKGFAFYAQQRGWKKRAAIFRYKECFGEEPAAKWVKPVEPSEQQRNYILSQVIRAAKGRKSRQSA